MIHIYECNCAVWPGVLFFHFLSNFLQILYFISFGTEYALNAIRDKKMIKKIYRKSDIHVWKYLDLKIFRLNYPISRPTMRNYSNAIFAKYFSFEKKPVSKMIRVNRKFYK